MAARGEAVAELIEGAATGFALGLSAPQLDSLARYAALVCKWRRIANLTAATTALQFAREHIVDCLAIAPHLGAGTLLDVGSGAGLPGVVLALVDAARPVTLLEARARRARFLTQVRIDLGLTHVAVVNQRIEEFVPVAPYRYLVTRAFGPLAGFIARTRHLHAAGTFIMAMKAELTAEELDACGAARSALEVIPLAVPGYRRRHLVRIDCARLAAAGEAPGLVP